MCLLHCTTDISIWKYAGNYTKVYNGIQKLYKSSLGQISYSLMEGQGVVIPINTVLRAATVDCDPHSVVTQSQAVSGRSQAVTPLSMARIGVTTPWGCIPMWNQSGY